MSVNSRGRGGGRFERMAALQILAIPTDIAVVCALPCAQTTSPASAGPFPDKFLDVVAGRREQLVGKIQERCGVAKDDAEKQIAEWQRKATDAWFIKP